MYVCIWWVRNWMSLLGWGHPEIGLNTTVFGVNLLYPEIPGGDADVFPRAPAHRVVPHKSQVIL